MLVIIRVLNQTTTVPRYIGTKQIRAAQPCRTVSDGGKVQIWGHNESRQKENPMAMGTRERREKDNKLLVAKFIKLVESLNPGERLSIKRVTAKGRMKAHKRRAKAQSQPRKAAVKRAGRRAAH
jgi:hypothetical protein